MDVHFQLKSGYRYIFLILQHIAAKLCNFSNVKMLAFKISFGFPRLKFSQTFPGYVLRLCLHPILYKPKVSAIDHIHSCSNCWFFCFPAHLRIEEISRRLRTGDLGIPDNPEDRYAI